MFVYNIGFWFVGQIDTEDIYYYLFECAYWLCLRKSN